MPPAFTTTSRLLACGLLVLLAGGCGEDSCEPGDAAAVLVVHHPDRPSNATTSSARDFTDLRAALAAVDPDVGNTFICVASGTWRGPFVVGAHTTLRARTGARFIPPADASGAQEPIIETRPAPGQPVVLSGLTVQGGQVGILAAGAGLTQVLDSSIDGVAVGVRADATNALELTGVDFTGNDLAVSASQLVELSLSDLSFTDNGLEPAEGAVGGALRIAGVDQVVGTDLRFDRNTSEDAVVALESSGFQLSGLDFDQRGEGDEAQIRLLGGEGLIERALFRLNTGSAVVAGSDGPVGSLTLRNSQISHRADFDAVAPGLRIEDTTLRLEHVTIATGGDVGTALQARGSGPLTVRNSVLWGYPTALDQGDLADRADIEHSLLPGLPESYRDTQGTLLNGNLELDPGFSDPAGNFQPASGSPLIDAGADLGIEEDLLGRARPAGAAPDIGAYEQPEED